jgi:hypothetical protein
MRALATEGIQRGHMSLHARQIALAAGAQGSEVDIIAARMVQERQIKPARAEALLTELRALLERGRRRPQWNRITPPQWLKPRLRLAGRTFKQRV